MLALMNPLQIRWLAQMRGFLPTQRRTLSSSTKPSTLVQSDVAQSNSSSPSLGEQTLSILQALAAAGAGVLTVSGAAALVEQTASCPPYDPKSTRFDQQTFEGRFAQMLLACDPRLLIFSYDQVVRAKSLLDAFEQQQSMTAETTTEPIDSRTLWEARRLVDSAVHPDSGEFVPRPFRMSGYVPFNGPICVAMMVSQSTAPLLFWSFCNQSQNALVNYANRNAASPCTNATLATSYGVAVSSSMVVAFGLATFIQRRFPPARAQELLRWVAFPSAVVASSLNCYIMRSPELVVGVPLCDYDGNDVLPGERSHMAAKEGVYSTTASRALLPAPVFAVPPMLLGLPWIRNFITKHPNTALPISTYLLLVSFGLGLPATVALFPQQAPIAPSSVEEKFQHLRDPRTGEPYSIFYYNKGL